ncbi:MAG: alpha/beta fold hydrolase [Marinosulfonomonas sp.]
MIKHFNSFDGTRLAYCDEGQGVPVLCLAGLTRDARDFDYVAPFLKGARVICLDYRGRGASDWSEDFNSYSIPTEAQDVVALLDHLNLPKVAVLGTSRGGLIAMLMAAAYKDRLIGVCLNDIGPDIASDGLDKILGYIGRPPPFRTHQEMADAMAERMVGFANVPPDRWLQEVQRHSIETDAGLQLTYDPRLRDAMIAASAAPPVDLWPLFEAMADLPLALIRGANSDLLTPETAQEMQRRRPDMVFATVPDRAHVPFLDEPEAVAALTKWLELCQ